MNFAIVAATDVGIPNGVAPLDDSGVVGVTFGGTGVSSISGLLKGNGAAPFSTALPGVDYLTPATLGVPGGIATLDSSGKLDVTQLPTEFNSITVSSLTGFMYANGAGLVTASIKIPVDSLSTSSFTLGTSQVDLGGVVTTLTGVSIDGTTNTISNIGNISLVNSAITIGTNTVSLGETVTYVSNLTLDKVKVTGPMSLGDDVGNVGYVLTSSGPGVSPRWAQLPEGNPGTVTSVSITVPSFLSVTGSPITSSGTFDITLSGTPLPVANGGTGVTSLSGVLFGDASTSAVVTATGQQIVEGIGAVAVQNSTHVHTDTTGVDSDLHLVVVPNEGGFQSLLTCGVTLNPHTGAITSGIYGGLF